MIDRYCPWSVSGSSVQRFFSDASFARDYANDRIHLSRVQRAILTVGAAAISFANPFRGDMIACLGETTGSDGLVHCYRRLLSTSEGRRILEQKPRIFSSTIDLSALKRLPVGTVGRTYREFLDANVSPLNSFIHYFISFPISIATRWSSASNILCSFDHLEN